MNQITYIVYIVISSIIVIYVGNFCYKNGKIYILSYFPNDVNFGNGINRLLRVAYYLLNIGLAIWTLNSVKNIENIEQVILELSNRLSFILLVIGVLHFINIYTVYLIQKHFKNQ